MEDEFGFESQLHRACALGEEKKFAELIQNHKDLGVVVIGDRNSTLLHIAAEYGQVSILKTLLKTIAAKHILSADHEGDTPIHVAANNIDAFRVLYDKFRSENPNMHVDDVRNKKKRTCLHYAAGKGNLKVVRFLLGKTVLYDAAENGDSAHKGNNPFHWAAMNGNSLVMEALRSHNVDPLSKNKEKQTPFLLALINNHLDFAKNLGKCLGKDLRDGMWLEDLRTWTDAFIDESLIKAFKLEMRKFNIVMPDELQDSDKIIIKEEMPFTYKAFYGKKDEGTTNFIQEISNVNKAGTRTGRTALHWATIFNQKEIVFSLCKQKDLVAFFADKQGKTPLDYATHSEILRELMKRPDVKFYERKHYRDMERYVSACNAILVSAALIVNVTFGGWLHPPWNHSFEYVHRFGALRIFWIFNGSSFFFAIATVVAAASALLPAPYRGISDGATSIRKSLSYAAALLVISIVFVFGAFAAASFVVLPRSSKNIKLMIWGIASGALLGSCLLWRSVHGLYKVHSRPSSPEAQPAQSESERPESSPSHPQSDGDPYKLGGRYEYLPWDDGLEGASNG